MTTTKSRKKSRKPRRGRWIVGVLLIGFVVVASAVIWRRSFGITEAKEIARLDRRMIQLEAERGHLAALIRDESSQTRLGPIVLQMGMRLPDDAHVRTIRR